MKTAKALHTKLLEDLQDTLVHGTVARRVEALRLITDLFIEGSDGYSDAQLAVFDDVFDCFVRVIESETRALLSQRVAPISNPPRGLVRQLAFDDAIDVAAPVLSLSTALDDATLIENARCKSQAHMLAISTRKTLTGKVADVLLELGDHAVVRSTMNNAGAEVSDRGYAIVAGRIEHDDALAALFGAGAAIPRHRYLKLVAKASSIVRQRLEACHPNDAASVASAVRQVGRRARSAPAAMSRETTIAHGLVRSLFEDGRLDETLLMSFIAERKFDETNAALSCLAGVTVDVSEAMMIEARDEGVLILCKVAKLAWPTVEALIQMRSDLAGLEAGDLAACRATYGQLRPTTAQQVLRFHRMQIEEARQAAVSAA